MMFTLDFIGLAMLQILFECFIFIDSLTPRKIPTKQVNCCFCFKDEGTEPECWVHDLLRSTSDKQEFNLRKCGAENKDGVEDTHITELRDDLIR